MDLVDLAHAAFAQKAGDFIQVRNDIAYVPVLGLLGF
jgi:hypothetical protein